MFPDTWLALSFQLLLVSCGRRSFMSNFLLRCLFFFFLPFYLRTTFPDLWQCNYSFSESKKKKTASCSRCAVDPDQLTCHIHDFPTGDHLNQVALQFTHQSCVWIASGLLIPSLLVFRIPPFFLFPSFFSFVFPFKLSNGTLWTQTSKCFYFSVSCMSKCDQSRSSRLAFVHSVNRFDVFT